MFFLIGNIVTIIIVNQFKIFRVYGENCKLEKYFIKVNGNIIMSYSMFFIEGA